MRLYIAILDEFPDFMVPTLVAHSMLGAHLEFSKIVPDNYWGGTIYAHPTYMGWLRNSFRKCTVRVNQKEFDKIAALPFTYLGHENRTLEGRKSCAIPLPREDSQLPNVLKFAKLWTPKLESNNGPSRPTDQ